jgi:hypothetical protein
MFEARMEHLFSYAATLQAPPEVIGPVPEGIRANFHITGGVATGPKVRGKLRAVGADFATLRRDGMIVIDVQAVLETDDGALIALDYAGLGEMGDDGYDKFLRGELPKRVPLRTTPRLRSAHPAYQWLHRLQFVGVGEANLETFTVAYDVYAVR